MDKAIVTLETPCHTSKFFVLILRERGKTKGKPPTFPEVNHFMIQSVKYACDVDVYSRAVARTSGVLARAQIHLRDDNGNVRCS